MFEVKGRGWIACLLLCVNTIAHGAVGRTEGSASVSATGAAQYSIELFTAAGTTSGL